MDRSRRIRLCGWAASATTLVALWGCSAGSEPSSLGPEEVRQRAVRWALDINRSTRTEKVLVFSADGSDTPLRAIGRRGPGTIRLELIGQARTPSDLVQVTQCVRLRLPVTVQDRALIDETTGRPPPLRDSAPGLKRHEGPRSCDKIPVVGLS